MEFGGRGGAAEPVALLDEQRLEAGFGQIERGDEGVVAGADEDDFAGSGQGMSSAEDLSLENILGNRPFLKSSRMASAPRRPGAPMMPPPGCVAEPHM